VSLFSVSASAAEAMFDPANEFFRAFLLLKSAAARLQPRPFKSVDA
jgi:hypothetical protein